jgi:hypothetical protein
MISNEAKWVDVTCEGEVTGHKYFGRFMLKPYATLGEKEDISRTASQWARGIDDTLQKGLITTRAFLKFHILDTDAKWWKESEDGKNLYDEAPIYALVTELRKLQRPEEETKTEE